MTWAAAWLMWHAAAAMFGLVALVGRELLEPASSMPRLPTASAYPRLTPHSRPPDALPNGAGWGGTSSRALWAQARAAEEAKGGGLLPPPGTFEPADVRRD